MSNQVVSTTLVARGAGTYRAQMASAAKANTAFGASAAPAAAKSGRLQGRMSGLAGGAGLVSGAMLGAGGVVYALKSAVGAATDFESSAMKLQTQIGLSAEESDRLAESARNIGTETGRGAQEAVDASFFIASAGLRGADAMDALERSAQAARVGLGDTKDVADLVTSAMNAYGPETLDAANATDILVGAVREGKAEASELSSSLGQVLPVASEMGVTFDEVGAAVASMTRTGTDAGTASMQLRQILSGMINPAQGVQAAMEEFGLSAQGVRDTIRNDGLWAALMELRDATGGNEEALGRLFPNVRSLAGFLDMTGANAEETEQIFARMADTTGYLDDAVDKVADTTQDKLNRALSGLKDQVLDVGEGALPVLNGALDDLNTALDESDSGWSWTGSAVDSVRSFGADLSYVGDLAIGAGLDIAEAMGAPQENIDALRGDVKETSDVLGQYLPDAATQAETGLMGLRGTSTSTAGAIDELGASGDGAADGLTSAADAATTFNETMRAMTDPVFGAMNALEGLETAQRDVAEAQKEVDKLRKNGKKGTDDYAEAVRGLEAAQLAEVEAAFSAQGAMTELAGAVAAGEVSADQMMGALDRLIADMGLTGSSADAARDRFWDLFDSMDSIPADVRTDVRVESAQAEAALQRVLSGINSIPRRRHVEVSVRSNMTSGGAAMGLTERASGGPLRSRELALVGEEGPELVQFGQPSFVHDAGTTAQMMAASSSPQMAAAAASSGGSGGGMNINLGGIHVSGSVVTERELVETVRKGISSTMRDNGLN